MNSNAPTVSRGFQLWSDASKFCLDSSGVVYYGDDISKNNLEGF